MAQPGGHLQLRALRNDVGRIQAGRFFVVIVPGSGTGELAGITGTGGIAIDPDGTHRIWFDYDLDQ
ncbi:DUF3224 domain-containing protein [Streptomyces sp. NRRL S-920]|uniref:DUF3224 domain-containing protein n=1 Tax=Streptomyces sp. NRRL S-920 TaxID=1463921 RepID=UPI002D21D964|nr:DUF3224 domain-containing protein [Streptomyces sp. NRRL S-920]